MNKWIKKNWPTLVIFLIIFVLLRTFFFAFNRFYKYKTELVNEEIIYEKQIEFEGIVLFNQDFYPILGLNIDLKRIGANSNIAREQKIEGKYDLNSLFPYIEKSKKSSFFNDKDKDKIIWENDKIILKNSGFLVNYPKNPNFPSFEDYLNLEIKEVERYIKQDYSVYPGFSIVDNFEYIMAVISDEKISEGDFHCRIDEVDFYGKNIFRRFDGYKYLSFIYVDENIDMFLTNPKIEGIAIENTFPSYKLNKSVLSENNTVMKKNDSGITEEIEINNYYIDNGKIYIDINEDIDYYDEIFLHPKLLKKGEFIE